MVAGAASSAPVRCLLFSCDGTDRYRQSTEQAFCFFYIYRSWSASWLLRRLWVPSGDVRSGYGDASHRCIFQLYQFTFTYIEQSSDVIISYHELSFMLNLEWRESCSIQVFLPKRQVVKYKATLSDTPHFAYCRRTAQSSTLRDKPLAEFI